MSDLAGIQEQFGHVSEALNNGLPQHGTYITFSVLPIASWATVGDVYRVTRDGDYIHLWNEKRNCGTQNRAWAYETAKWTTVLSHWEQGDIAERRAELRS